MDAYLPQDRRYALINMQSIPERCRGTVLFADLSGFTPLTEALSKALSPRQAAERLAQQITRLYDTLTAQVDQWHGSVVGFAGDAITTWFDDQDGASVERAIACALAMQQAMPDVSVLTLPNGDIHKLALKVSIAYGPTRRMVVGDPQIQVFDTLAGSTLLEVAAVEHLAHPGEVLINETAAQMLGLHPTDTEWLTNPDGIRAIAVSELATIPSPEPWPHSDQDTLHLEQLQPWILPAIYERYEQSLSDFLSELRPAVPMFVRFASLDYDNDEAAGAYLNEFISAAQQIIHRYGGTLLQIVIGDKGSSMYAVFGAPISHENDASRAALAALELHQLAQALPIIAPLQIGITQGTLLVGAYGRFPSRTYAAMGDSVNVAARLMMAAAPGETLVTDRIHELVAEAVELEVRTPLRLKGKTLPQPVSAVLAARQRRGIRLEEPRYQLPMVGRYAELEQIKQILSSVAAGQGQVLGISGEAGQGKSRLVAEAIRLAHIQGFTSYGGACLSIGKHMPYLVWESIWQSFFEVGPDSATLEAEEQLRRRLETLVPDRVELMPLLGLLLGVTLVDNQLTHGLEPQDRQRALHALLRDCMIAAVQAKVFPPQRMLFILEDLHWIDDISFTLLLDLAHVISVLPVLIIVAYRSDPENQADIQRFAEMEHWRSIELVNLNDDDAATLIKMKLFQLNPSASSSSVDALTRQLLLRTQNNPFYLEELLNYLHDQNIDLQDLAAFEAIDLPDSVQRLVLSRLDQLSVRQQALMKSASVIGRRFLIAWLQGAFGTMQYTDNLYSELSAIKQADLIDLDIYEPEVAYIFKHVITRDVAYSTLSDSTRTMLHEQVAMYLEYLTGARSDIYLDLLAYHYDHSNNLEKRCKYLRLAGEAAMLRYANESAISYFTHVLALLTAEDLEERYELMILLNDLYGIIGDARSQESNLDALDELVDLMGEAKYRVNVMLRRAEFSRTIYGGKYGVDVVNSVYNASFAENMLDVAAKALISYGWSIINLGRPDIGENQIKRALELASQLGYRDIEIDARTLNVAWLWAYGRYVECVKMVEETLSLCKDKPRYEAHTLAFSGSSLFEMGKIEEGIENVEKAMKLYYLVDDRQYIWMILGLIIRYSAFCGDFAKSRDYIERAEQWSRSVEINTISIHYSFSIAIFFDQIGDYVQAHTIMEQALEKVRTFGYPTYTGTYLNVSVLILLHLGDLELALERSRESLTLMSEGFVSSEYAFALTLHGHILSQLEQWEEAENIYLQAHDLRKRFEQVHFINEPLAGMARSALALGQREKVVDYIHPVISYLENTRLSGTFEPFLVYLTCYEVLLALDDQRAVPLLSDAYQYLQSRAMNLSDLADRRRFLEEVSVHRRIVMLWEHVSGSTPESV